MAQYFVHLPPDGSPGLFWRRLAGFAGELIQINLNLLGYAVGDDPTDLLPPTGRLVPRQNYTFGNAPGENVSLQPFAFTLPGGDRDRPQALPLGPNLRRFLDSPLDGERLDLSLPFYDEDIKLGCNGGGWLRNNNGDNSFHAATDFNTNTSPTIQFDVCAAAGGRILAMAGGRIVLSHTTAGGVEFRTVYVHMDLDTVSKDVGDVVRRGELLGRTDGSTNPIHLHFGVAVHGPAFHLHGVDIPELWYFLDPWGVYDLRVDHYLPTSGRIFEAAIIGAVHTVQWRTQPIFKTIPIARSTDDYREIVSIQLRTRRSSSTGGTLPAEHEQFLVWLRDDPQFFLVPLTQETDRTMEVELVTLLRECFLQGKKARLEYRYVGSDRYIMAAWIRA